MPKNREKLHTILSDYTVGGNIGNGGAGSVYSVTDENGQSLAAKILDQNASQETL